MPIIWQSNKQPNVNNNEISA